MTTPRILYLGAGGGGDTNAAVMCALADKSPGEKFVLGAGYAIKEYKDSFAKQQNSRKIKGQIDRKIVSDPKLTVNYLNESLKNYLDENADINATSVWRLNDSEKGAMEALFNDVKPDTPLTYDDPAIQKQYSSYKYQALLEERLLLRKLKDDLGDNPVLNNIYMFFTTSRWDNNDEINTSYNALKEFIINKTIQKVVLMDFGGDLIEFTKPGRDPIVLLNSLRLLQDIQNLTIEVWVYGPGVDSHALPSDVIDNIRKFQQITSTPEDIASVDINPLVDFIKNKSDLLNQIDVLGLNRATGNWYEAYNNCTESIVKGGARRKNKKRGGGVTIVDYIKDGLQARSEYDGLKTQDAKDIMDIGWRRFFENTSNSWCELAKTYKFTFNNPLNDTFWSVVKSIQPKFTLDLQKTTLGGGKPKDLKKTAEKVKVGKRDAVVYATPRGAKYVVIKGSYIKVKDIAKTLKNLQKNK